MASRKASRAAKLGWETRRAREAQDARDLAYLLALTERDARIEAERRSAAARKGWRTRDQRRREIEREIAPLVERGKRSEAARKGWETRRAKAKGRTTGGERRGDEPEEDEWEIEVGLDYEP